jgi:ubiquitin carboxyl-terminal hydrolase 5/13
MFGFTEKQAKRGLRKCDGNQERAADWIMNHMDDPDSEDEEAEAPKQPAAEVKSLFKDEEPNKGAYSLHGTITHLGASVHAGHYVCHVKKEGKWIYFNDSKVAETDDPPLGKGYMYFFRKAQK